MNLINENKIFNIKMSNELILTDTKMLSLLNLINLDQKNLNQIQEFGQQLYQKNSNYRDLGEVMENPEFQHFFNKYMSNEFDTKMTLQYMRLYNIISKYNKELNGYHKLYIIWFLNKHLKDKNDIKKYTKLIN